MERFDLALRQRDYFLPGLQALFKFIRTATFREGASELSGYDVSDAGNVHWVNWAVSFAPMRATANAERVSHPSVQRYIACRNTSEGWPSGLRRTLGKRVYGKPYRGFESHSLRQRLKR
jgi:hypothetical protein